MTSDLKSQLERHQPKPAATPEELHKLATAAWHERHVLVAGLDDPAIILSEMDRGYLEAVGIKLYGRRHPK